MKCPECQTEISDGSKFCNQCGSKFDADRDPINTTDAAEHQDITADPTTTRNQGRNSKLRNIIIACLLVVVGIGGYLYSARDSIFIKGDPDQLMNAYYQNLKDAKYENAYEMLSQANKNMYSIEEFVLDNQLTDEGIQLKDYKLARGTDYKNKDIDGNKFAKVIEYDVTQNRIMYSDDKKESTVTVKRHIVAENGTWRVYREKEDMKATISDDYVAIGYMYQEGKGKDKDLYAAIGCYKKAMSYNPNSPNAYFQLGYVYSQLGNYDDAIRVYYQDLALAESDSVSKSLTYSNLGAAYLGKGDRVTAIDCLKKALELNPDN